MTISGTLARAALAALSLSALSACSGLDVREELGLNASGPDEFLVVRNRDLEVPADLPTSVDALPEPTLGGPNRADPTPLADAAAALGGFDTPGSGTGAASAAEDALLVAAGAGSADPNVRAQLEAEAADAEDDIRLLDGLLGTDRESAEALDAAAEAERLAREAGIQ